MQKTKFIGSRRSQRSLLARQNLPGAKKFASWPDPIAKLIAATPSEQIAFGEICDFAPIFPWSQNNATLIGDAAHAMTPNFGQGGGQAIEDAIVLSMAVQANKEPTRAFEAYEAHRCSRAKRNWSSARVNTDRSPKEVIGLGGSSVITCCQISPPSMMDRAIRDQLNVQRHLDAFASG